MAFALTMRDSLLELDYKVNLTKLNKQKKWLDNPMQLQKLMEYKEILNVPHITYNSKLPDSTNVTRERKIKKDAQLFVDEYGKKKQEWNRLKAKVDSLGDACTAMFNKIQAYKNLINAKLNNANSIDGLAKDLKAYGIQNTSFLKKYRPLLSIRKLSLGRSPVNYSDLTSKNISLTGINFEYNSWYYFALAAGTVDYRFRDFVINKNLRSPQYLYLIRLGVGRVENTHIIFSFFKGKKQLFAVSNGNSGSNSIDVSGVAAELKYRFNKNGYIMGEVAESLSPDYRQNPATVQKFDLKDRSNKALSAKFYYYIPKTNSKFEANYKYTGANFQSFSSFQTNSALKAWSVKADQQFFKRKLKLTASLSSNEFSNPYIVQQYKANTIYKSFQASFRAKHFPSIRLGYVPSSQITSINDQLVENHFNSINGSITHNYKIRDCKAASTFIYSKFYNNESDTSFLFYNAENYFFTQSIIFPHHTQNVSVSHSKSPGFELSVLDGGLQFELWKWGQLGFGVKINAFDKKEVKTGGYGSLQFAVRGIGNFNMSYENGFLPSGNHRFIRNEILNMNFTRSF